MNKPHIYGIAWFTEHGPPFSNTRQTVGIVLAWTKAGEHRAFIGVAPTGVDPDESGDARFIVECGAPFPLSEAKSVIKNFGKEVTFDI